MKDIDANNEELAQLRWACRRGMLELDLMLRRFLDACFQDLDPTERSIFKALLKETDQDLFAFLLGSKMPLDPKFPPLIKKIQAYAQTAASVTTF